MKVKYKREEEDGSITYVYAYNCGGILKTHNNKGPALINEKQKIEEYYLYGVKLDKGDWQKKSKFS